MSTMDPEDKAWLWFFGLLILCGVLFGGSPDLVDRVGKSLSDDCTPLEVEK